MQSGEAILVHSNPWPDEQHRSAGSADDVSKDPAEREKEGIFQWARSAWDHDMDAARHDKERADHHDEAEVFETDMEQPRAAPENEQIITRGNRRERDTEQMIITFPMIPND